MHAKHNVFSRLFSRFLDLIWNPGIEFAAGNQDSGLPTVVPHVTFFGMFVLVACSLSVNSQITERDIHVWNKLYAGHVIYLFIY